MMIAPSFSLWNDKKEWTKEELLNQLRPMCKLLLLAIFKSCSSNAEFVCLLSVFSDEDPDAVQALNIDSVRICTSFL